MNDEEADATALPLDHFRWPHQIATLPWGGNATASFQVGADGVTGIELTAAGVVVYVTKATTHYELWFAAGGFGFRTLKPEFRCDECEESFPAEVERDAHKRSHRPNHKGSGK